MLFTVRLVYFNGGNTEANEIEIISVFWYHVDKLHAIDKDMYIFIRRAAITLKLDKNSILPSCVGLCAFRAGCVMALKFTEMDIDDIKKIER